MSLTRKLANRLSNYRDPKSFAARLRARRLAPLLAMIEDVFRQHGFVNVVDIGGTEAYWNIVPGEYLDRHKVSITLVNLPGVETSADHGRFRFVAADGCDLAGMGDGSFHIAHSNSVVEHVGDWDHMRQFAQEVRRVAPKYFVQTPDYRFPIEPHCMTPLFHWLPKRVRVWMVLHFQLGHWSKAATVDEAVQTVDSARLLTKAKFRALFDDAQILTERLFLLPKSLIAVRN